MSRHSFPPMQKLLHFLDPRTKATNQQPKRFPVYTQDHKDYFISPDDPLPYELKDRVDAFMDHASRFTDFQQTLQQIQTFSTFNAFVRQQITDKQL